MNGVVTQKELKTLLKEKKSKVESKSSVKEEVKIQIEEQEVPVSKEEHYLFHPDNSNNRSHYRQGGHIIKLKDTEVTVPIVNGCAITDSAEIKSELIKQGFVFMYTKPKE